MPSLNLLERHITPERLQPYRLAAGGDLALAIRLYEWNLALSGAFIEVLALFEVILRNALHEHLTAWYGIQGGAGDWYDHPILDRRRREDVAGAKMRIRQAGRQVTPGRVIAELPFGFWRFLLDRRAQALLWGPVLRRAFPHLGHPRQRLRVYTPVDHLSWLRNRIAHHEPIHGLDLTVYHEQLIQVLSYIEPDLATYAVELSRVDDVLELRPMA